MRSARFWIALIIAACLLMPTFGVGLFMLNWARVAGKLSTSATGNPIVILLTRIARVPVVIDAFPAWIFNGVFWGAALSIAFAFAFDRLAPRRQH